MWLIVGGVRSIMMVAVWPGALASSTLPAKSSLQNWRVWVPSLLITTLVPVPGLPSRR